MGIFTLVVTTQELAYLGCLSWFSMHALRNLPGNTQGAEGRSEYLETENAVVLGSSLALVMVALLFTASLPADPSPWWQAAAISAFFVARACNAHYAERARAQSSYLAYTLLQSVGPIGGLALGLLALHFFEPTATVLCASYAVANLLGTVIAFPLLGMTRHLRRPHATQLRAALSYGGPILGLFMLGWLAENHLRYLVQWQSGAIMLGLMAVGWGLGRRCASVAAMLVTTAGFPLASRMLNEGRRGEAIMQLSINAALLLAIMLPVCAGLAYLGPAIVELAVAPSYRDATNEVLALSVIAGGVRCMHVHITDQWLILERRFVLAAWVDGIEIVACGASSVAGLALFGLRGAVAGQLAGSALTLVVSMYWATSRFGFRWPWNDTAKVLAATAIMSAALAAMETRPTLQGIAMSVVAGAAIYGLTIGLLYTRPLRVRLSRLVQRMRP
jgi:O-antigen/teichoic acid export membrane protein